MITFAKNNQKFNFRTAGITIADNRVLLHRSEKDDFWTFPGGRVELGETSQEGLIRELKEELNADIEMIRLLWVVENFFEYDRQNYHEIAFYYLMKLETRSLYLNPETVFYGVENDNHLEFKWFPLDGDLLHQLPLLLTFLQYSLNDLPTTPEHVIERYYQKL